MIFFCVCAIADIDIYISQQVHPIFSFSLAIN